MSRKAGGGGDHGDDMGHGDRPWVYFMIDSFFLVTQFFVLTFKLKIADDLILPHKLPPGGGAGKAQPDLVVAPKTPVAITVNRDTPESAPWYKINGGELLDLNGLTNKLGEIVEGRPPENFSVRVSYEGKVIFKDIMPIFNACIKLKIKECGLQISRDKVAN